MNETYNTPGTSGDKNWSLRLPDNFENMTPINLPLILKKGYNSKRKQILLKKIKKLIEELDEIQ